MKKLLLILTVSLSLFACKDKGSSTELKDNSSVSIDTTSNCYRQSFFYDVQFTLNNGNMDTLEHVSKLPNFNQCQGAKWCLVDANSLNVVATDVKSFKSIGHYFDTTAYVKCSE
jgi:hypothetical protein